MPNLHLGSRFAGRKLGVHGINGIQDTLVCQFEQGIAHGGLEKDKHGERAQWVALTYCLNWDCVRIFLPGSATNLGQGGPGTSARKKKGNLPFFPCSPSREVAK